MPLSLADLETNYVIIRLGGKKDVKKHLETLGFVPGATIKIIAVNNGNVIVSIKDSRVAISEELAKKIYV